MVESTEKREGLVMLLKLVRTVNACLTDYVLLFLLVGVGVWYSVKTKFVQVRWISPSG